MNPDEVRQQWVERDAAYSPGYYAYYGPDERSDQVRNVLDAIIDPDDAVLEVGCSSGRHLAHLHEHGYTNLHGIEINDDALDVMEDTYPELAAAGTFSLDAIENVVPEFEDGRFDAVYSVETLQHLHPDDAWAFEDLARITDDVLLTLENEGDGESTTEVATTGGNAIPLYFRRWDRVFTAFGFDEVESTVIDRVTLRTFRPAGSIDEESH